jgi:hypothetical protein
MPIWRMRITCRIPKATNTHSQYVILIAFPPQQWLRERASMLRYTYSTACLSGFDSHLFSDRHYGVITLLQLCCVCPANFRDMPMCPCMSIAFQIREKGYVLRRSDKVRGWISGSSRSFSSPKRSDLLWTPPSFLVRGIRGSFPGVERPGRETDLSPSSSAKVRNECSCTSAPPIILHGVD